MVTLRLDFRVLGVRLYIQIEVISVQPAADLLGRCRTVLVAASHRAPLRVKRLLRAVQANGRAGVAVAPQAVPVRPLDPMPPPGAGERRPGVREVRRDVEVVAVLRGRSGTFL